MQPDSTLAMTISFKIVFSIDHVVQDVVVVYVMLGTVCLLRLKHSAVQ